MKFVWRHIETVKSQWNFLQDIARIYFVAMYNAAPGMFAFYGNQRPPQNVANFASPMGFQFSPRGYQQYAQSKYMYMEII